VMNVDNHADGRENGANGAVVLSVEVNLKLRP